MKLSVDLQIKKMMLETGKERLSRYNRTLQLERTIRMHRIEEVAIVEVKLLADVRAKFVAISSEYGGVKVSEKWTYLN